MDALILDARQMRNLARLSVEAERFEGVAHDVALSLASEDLLRRTAFKSILKSGGRFKQRPIWRRSGKTLDLLAEIKSSLQNSIDDSVEALFGRLPLPHQR